MDKLEVLHLENGDYLTMSNDKYRHRKPYKEKGKMLAAVIPGTIMSVLVKEGQTIRRGDALCIIDSMKMNNVICADSEGTISRIHIKEGEVVAKNAPMIELF